MKRILLVEDDQTLALTLRERLENEVKKNLAIRLEMTDSPDTFTVYGRGEMSWKSICASATCCMGRCMARSIWSSLKLSPPRPWAPRASPGSAWPHSSTSRT